MKDWEIFKNLCQACVNVADKSNDELTIQYSLKTLQPGFLVIRSDDPHPFTIPGWRGPHQIKSCDKKRRLAVTEADGTGTDERKGYAPVTLQGVRPLFTKEPKRKRGYHRALKRGEPWALMRRVMTGLMNNLCKQILGPIPFLNLLNQKMEDNAKMLVISYFSNKKPTLGRER